MTMDYRGFNLFLSDEIYGEHVISRAIDGRYWLHDRRQKGSTLVRPPGRPDQDPILFATIEDAERHAAKRAKMVWAPRIPSTRERLQLFAVALYRNEAVRNG